MKKYRFRLKSYGDEIDLYECINCKNDFACQRSPFDEKWKYCPFCGCSWDEEFTKKNPRWPQKNECYPIYELEKKGNIKFCKDDRLFIFGNYQYKDCLSRDMFAAIKLLHPKISTWVVLQHCKIGQDIHGKSTAVHMCNAFKKYCTESKWYQLQLVLYKDNKSTIIKQYTNKDYKIS